MRQLRSHDIYPRPPRPPEQPDWPDCVRESFLYDRQEVWGERFNPGYYWGYLSRRQATLDAATAMCAPPARVLDLAAAQGNFSIALASMGYQVTWNDLRADLEPYVRLKAPSTTAIDCLVGNIFELGCPKEGQYDLVLATEVIEHVAHPDQFLAKLAQLVRPGGHILMTTPNGAYVLNDLPRFSDCPDPSVFESVQFKPNSDGHIFLLYEDEIRRFAAACGLIVIACDLITSPLTAGHVKLRHILKRMPDAAVYALENGSRRLPYALRQRLSTHLVVALRKPETATA